MSRNTTVSTQSPEPVACSHVFSDQIAPGRPDEEDWKIFDDFADRAAEKPEA